jgi:uncharacterized Tic20 family protein
MEQPPSLQPEHVPVFAPTRQERTWAMLAHLLPIPAITVAVGHIIAPLIIWLIKREESPFVNDQAKEALNFQISYSIYGLICGALSLACVGFLLMIILAVAWVVLAIIAAVRANDGIAYRYPLILRLVP